MKRFEFWRDNIAMEVKYGDKYTEEQQKRYREVFNNPYRDTKGKKTISEITVFNRISKKTKTYTADQLTKLLGTDIVVIEHDVTQTAYNDRWHKLSDEVPGYEMSLNLFWDTKRIPAIIDIPDLTEYEPTDILKFAIQMYRLHSNRLHMQNNNGKLCFGNTPRKVRKNMDGVKTLELVIAEVDSLPKSVIATIPTEEHKCCVSIPWTSVIAMLSDRAQRLLRLGFIISAIITDNYYNQEHVITDRAKLVLSLLQDAKLRGNSTIVIKTPLVDGGIIEAEFDELVALSAYNGANNHIISFGDNTIVIDLNTPNSSEDFEGL